MRNRWMWFAVAVTCCACFFMGTVVAQEGEDKGMGGMQMPAWMQKTQEHEDFKKSVGDWTVNAKFQMAPGAPPMETTAEAKTTLILNGFFMRQDYKGNMMGRPFEGVLHIGYDTIAKEFVSVWIDSMSPYLFLSRGKINEAGVLVLKGKEPDPMTGKIKDNEMTLEWTDADTYVFTFYSFGEDGTKTKGGEMVYKRKK